MVWERMGLGKEKHWRAIKVREIVGIGTNTESHLHLSHRHKGGRDDHFLQEGRMRTEISRTTWQNVLDHGEESWRTISSLSFQLPLIHQANKQMINKYTVLKKYVSMILINSFSLPINHSSLTDWFIFWVGQGLHFEISFHLKISK